MSYKTVFHHQTIPNIQTVPTNIHVGMTQQQLEQALGLTPGTLEGMSPSELNELVTQLKNPQNLQVDDGLDMDEDGSDTPGSDPKGSKNPNDMNGIYTSESQH